MPPWGSGELTMFASNRKRIIAATLAAAIMASSAPVLASCTVVGSALGNYTSTQIERD